MSLRVARRRQKFTVQVGKVFFKVRIRQPDLIKGARRESQIVRFLQQQKFQCFSIPRLYASMITPFLVVLIFERVPGSPFVPDQNLRNVVRTLQEIHQIRSYSDGWWGYGWGLDDTQDRFLPPRLFIGSTVQALPNPSREQATFFLETFLHHVDPLISRSHKTSTLHGDPKRAHFLLYKGQTYIVDWESVLFGPPEIDFAILVFSLLSITSPERIFAYAQSWEMDDALFNALLLWHACLYCLWNPWLDLLSILGSVWKQSLESIDVPPLEFLQQNKFILHIARLSSRGRGAVLAHL